MDANIIWWSAIALEGAVLCRGVFASLLRKYSLFYFYIGCILTTDLLRFCCYEFAPNHYQAFYWYTEVLTITASYGVILEIFRRSVRHHPGIARTVQTVLLVVFVLALSYAATDLLQGEFVSFARAIAELGRDLRYVEGALLLVMLWLFGRYRLSLGPNLLGLVVGYSFWIGINVLNLAFLFLPGNEFSINLRKLLPLTFLATLIIWCMTLWSARPEPAQPGIVELEHDYNLLAAGTRSVLARTSRRLARTTRQ
jgi:hypothetical protein